MDMNQRIAEIKRERRRQLRAVKGTTAGSVTVGSNRMSRREAIGGIVNQVQTYSISGGTVTQSGYSFFGSAGFDTSVFGR